MFRQMAPVMAVVFLWGCGGNDYQPPPPVPELTITCPAGVEAQSADGSPVSVGFSSPQTVGGIAPVALACTPPSGSLFPGGTTNAVCSATDSRGVVATCSVRVFVRVPPRLVGLGRFVAFGDSITAGKYSPPSLTVVESEFAYTVVLDRLLKERYRLQDPVVINAGISGEQAHVGGIARIRNVLLQNRPDVLLLMEGTNDLLSPSGIERGIDALRQLVSEAKALNVRVALATIPPQRSSPKRPPGIPELIPLFNERVRALASSEQVILVDVYNAMKDDLSLIGQDDLHPTPRGFEVIAETFFKVIQAQFEQPHPAVTLR